MFILDIRKALDSNVERKVMGEGDWGFRNRKGRRFEKRENELANNICNYWLFEDRLGEIGINL